MTDKESDKVDVTLEEHTLTAFDHLHTFVDADYMAEEDE